MTYYERARRAWRSWKGAPVVDLFKLIEREIDEAVKEAAVKRRKSTGECPRCKGKGGWETGPHSGTCPACDGTGKVLK